MQIWRGRVSAWEKFASFLDRRGQDSDANSACLTFSCDAFDIWFS